MKTKTLLLLFLFIGSGYFSFSQLSVTGSIKNEKAEPLPGATVLLENKSGFKKTTQSGNDGLFSITGVPQGENYFFTVSYVGYTNRVLNDIAIAPGKELNFEISLEPSKSTGDEIVVVAYSTQKKANLTGAVDQVSGKVLENRSISNLSQGLQGFIPNLNLVMGEVNPFSHHPIIFVAIHRSGKAEMLLY